METEALGRLLYQALREALSPREDALLALLLIGYGPKGAGRLLELTRQHAFRTRQAIQVKAAEILGLEYPGLGEPASPRQRAAQTAARARWARREPFVLPDTVQALLVQLMAPWND